MNIITEETVNEHNVSASFVSNKYIVDNNRYWPIATCFVFTLSRLRLV
jgi:hypothetical protein